MADRLTAYRSRRSAEHTPEPVPAEGPLPSGKDDTFVIQEHHARALHWDFRLERDGVLVSWAVPKGLPLDRKKNHLAVRTEDHPLQYAAFEGETGAGEYGAGRVLIWDAGVYECEKWADDEVKVLLHGRRVEGRYVLIRTGGTNWLIHRMDPPAAADWAPVPALIRPMLAASGRLPPPERDAEFAYEMKWDGVRAVVYVESGRVRVMSGDDRDLTDTFPELRALGEALGATPAVLDGEIVAFDPGTGRISASALRERRQAASPSRARRLAAQTPSGCYFFDLLYLDGHDTMGLPYRQRRELLESLDLRGPHWDDPPFFRGGGQQAVAVAREQRLTGVVAKRLDSRYEPGRRSRAWIAVRA